MREKAGGREGGGGGGKETESAGHSNGTGNAFFTVAS